MKERKRKGEMLYGLPLSIRDLGTLPPKKYKYYKIVQIEHQRHGKVGGANVS